MRKTPLKKIGKTGKANHLARLRIATIAEEKGLNFCELNLGNICTQTWPLAPAHRHDRAWYKGDVEKLSDYSQWVVGCQNCHTFMDARPLLRNEMFIMLRGPEEV